MEIRLYTSPERHTSSRGKDMELMNSMQSIFSIILMISSGVFFSYKKWFNQDTAKLFSKIVVNIAVPGFMISNLLSNYDKSKLIDISSGLVIPFSSMIIMYIIGVLLAKIIKLPSNQRGIFASTLSISNTLFVGLPVNVALFGQESVPYVFIYFIANITMFWTIGAFGINRDGGVKTSIISLENIKRIFSVPLISFLIAIILILLDVTLPKFIFDSCKYMGNLLTPLSMLYIGITLYYIDLKDFKWDKSMTLIIVGRFIISPLLVYILTQFIDIPNLMQKVFIIQAAMPAMTVTSVLAEAAGADYKYATILTTITTIFTLLFLPIYIFILS